ncbi:hypothetical protein [Arsenicicoccus sp. oral taxon 190]|uniref:hypothetical protein n=1 Tax=Arsenicicoccus sp. oral taxon 190 TaxID=1658671 RepID=UPI00067B1197|nr:hypothetical protein [Arsenicicoccus sp. oral taxon 190]
MHSPADHALVVVPAHDEADQVGAALTAVGAAAVQALRRGLVRSVHVVVVAHRCTDGTDLAARRHPCPPQVQRSVLVDHDSETVGEVRDHGVRTGAARIPDPRRCWLLSTDADSVVPPTWIADLLAVAARRHAVAVAGLVKLVDWAATPGARAAYDQILAAGMTGPDTHTHAYAANLAVRLDAYLAVGGFPAVPHGEETGLLQRLAAAGLRTTSTRSSTVRTAGRMPGRAALGLGRLLADLNDAETVGPDAATIVAPPTRIVSAVEG